MLRSRSAGSTGAWHFNTSATLSRLSWLKMALRCLRILTITSWSLPGHLLILNSNAWRHFLPNKDCLAILINNPTCRKLTCLHIQIDLDNNELSIDPDKLQSIHNECIATNGKHHLCRKAFQPLLGKLLYIHKCVPPAHTFINRMLALFR